LWLDFLVKAQTQRQYHQQGGVLDKLLNFVEKYAAILTNVHLQAECAFIQ
jgi:hypothetical protein